MGYLALVLLFLFGVLCIGVRGWMHYRQTGSSPFLSGAANGKATMVGFAIPFIAAAVGDLLDWLPRLAHSTALGVAGAALGVLGIAGTMYAQVAMGRSWRIGIDLDEHTSLVTTGPYRRVRNPIYTAMFAFVIGFAMVVPNVLAIASAVAVIAAISVVVRKVEEPYLVKEHGAEFSEWSKRTGRFLPPLHQT